MIVILAKMAADVMDGCEGGGIAAMSWLFVCCMCGVRLQDL